MQLLGGGSLRAIQNSHTAANGHKKKDLTTDIGYIGESVQCALVVKGFFKNQKRIIHVCFKTF